jgi:hypothetical protein
LWGGDGGGGVVGGSVVCVCGDAFFLFQMPGMYFLLDLF